MIWRLCRLALLRQIMEAHIGQVGVPTNSHYSYTGEPYMLFCIPTRRPVRDGFKTFRGYLKKIGYAWGAGYALYWRTLPEYDHGTLYFRLLVTNKPPSAASQTVTPPPY